jgi:hypothetical protein
MDDFKSPVPLSQSNNTIVLNIDNNTFTFANTSVNISESVFVNTSEIRHNASETPTNWSIFHVELQGVHNISVSTSSSKDVSSDGGENTAGENTSLDGGENTSLDEGKNTSLDEGKNTSLDGGEDTAGENTSLDGGEDTAGENTSLDEGKNTSLDEGTSLDGGEDTAGENTSKDVGEDTAGEDTAGENTAGEDTSLAVFLPPGYLNISNTSVLNETNTQEIVQGFDVFHLGWIIPLCLLAFIFIYVKYFSRRRVQNLWLPTLNIIQRSISWPGNRPTQVNNELRRIQSEPTIDIVL